MLDLVSPSITFCKKLFFYYFLSSCNTCLKNGQIIIFAEEPFLPEKPKLNISYIESKTVFSCEFVRAKRKDIGYSLQWYINGKIKHRQEIKKGVTKVYWNETESYTYSVGTQVSIINNYDYILKMTETLLQLSFSFNFCSFI